MDGLALKKLAKFFYKQSTEEREHALKFVKYVVEAGGIVVIPVIPAPKYSFASMEEVFKMCLDWEMEVTRNINALLEIAVKEKDFIAQQFLYWFANEQLEEVSTMDSMLKITLRSGEKNLLMLEAYLSHK